MKSPTMLVRILIVAAALAVGNLQAQVQTYSVILNGPSESPPVASAGTGVATIVLNIAAHTLAISMSFSGLTSGTTASHIHAATATAFSGTAGVATTTPTFAGFPLGVTSGTYSNTLDLTQASSYNPAFITANGGTTATAEAALISAIQQGKSYLNIHTGNNPGGEIRGFLIAVPEGGATFGFMLLGLAGLAATTRRLRRA